MNKSKNKTMELIGQQEYNQDLEREEIKKEIIEKILCIESTNALKGIKVYIREIIQE